MKMPQKKEEELCVLDVIRELWKALEKSKNLDEAKENFKLKVLELILGER